MCSKFVQENHLRWDSLREFLALTASLENVGIVGSNSKAKVLAKTLDQATGKFLDANKSPSCKTDEMDNRGSYFYLALFWALALAEQNDDPALQQQLSPLARTLADNEHKIVAELNQVQDHAVDIGGYYHPSPARASKAMCPSTTLNAALQAVKA